MDGKGNEFGLRCPKCGNKDELNVECRVFVTVVGEYVEDPYERSNMAYEPFSGWQWQSDDGAQCPKCGHTATVAAFDD
jgi:DNA-directed RNA polymerase subunit RPC12/RpoP